MIKTQSYETQNESRRVLNIILWVRLCARAVGLGDIQNMTPIRYSIDKLLHRLRKRPRAQTYSSYKGHNTVKFLIAISPTGGVMFVCKCWGGRVSDKHLTVHCGILNLLTHGDLVLADRGFDIGDDLAVFGATLAIPPFTKGKNQLSQKEVETARALSHVRIHVERAIGRVKQYKILQQTLPISILKHM